MAQADAAFYSRWHDLLYAAGAADVLSKNILTNGLKYLIVILETKLCKIYFETCEEEK